MPTLESSDTTISLHVCIELECSIIKIVIAKRIKCINKYLPEQKHEHQNFGDCPSHACKGTSSRIQKTDKRKAEAFDGQLLCAVLRFDA